MSDDAENGPVNGFDPPAESPGEFMRTWTRLRKLQNDAVPLGGIPRCPSCGQHSNGTVTTLEPGKFAVLLTCPNGHEWSGITEAIVECVTVRLSRHRTHSDCVVQIDVAIESGSRDRFETTALVEVARPASTRVLNVSYTDFIPGFVDTDELREVILLFREAVILSKNPRMDTTFHYTDSGLFKWTFVRQEEHA